jgi:hypothetical protein
MSQTKAQLLGPLVGSNIDVEGDLNFDSGTFKVDPTNNRVGINNANPTKTLDVGGDTQVADLYYTADYPTIRPTLDLAFDKVKRLDSRVTFTRTSTATYVDENGIIQTAAVDEPRFDHDPATGESLGLLIEESRTNLIDNSTDFATWNDGTGSGPNLTLRWIQSNVAIAPDGTNTASKLIPSTESDNQRIFKVIGSTNQYLNQILTFSVFAKAGEYTKIYLRNDSGGVSGIYVNLLDGTVISVSDQSIAYSITPYPNGWYKITLTGQETDSGSGHVPWISVVNDSDSYNYAGDGSDDGVYIWGAQVELGSFPTSYIPTSGSTVTRSRDIMSITGSSFTSFINNDEGTWSIDYKNVGTGAGLLLISDGTSGGRYMQLNIASDTQVSANLVNGSTVVTLSQNPIASSRNNFTKIAFAVKENDFAFSANGNTTLTDTTNVSLPIPTSLTLYYAPSIGSLFPYAYFRRLTYYPRRLNNSQLQNITL